MTNEEAIKILRDTPIDLRSTREDDTHTLYATAQNMAIDALLAEAEQVTGKLKNPCDSLLTADSDTCKESKSKLDLISRQDAINAIENTDCELTTKDWDELTGALKSLPSADRTEPGRWEIKQDTDEYGLKRPKLVCSKCEKEPAAWDLTELFDFCPNCGADMRGEKE